MNCPAWWPLPDSEPVGQDRVDELFAYLQSAAPAAVEAARAYVAGRHPGIPPRVYALPREQLANLTLDKYIGGVSVGSVTVRRPDDGYTVVSIVLLRSGHLAMAYDDEHRRAVTVVVG